MQGGGANLKIKEQCILRENEEMRKISIFPVSRPHLSARSYIRYDTLRKTLQKTEDAMHALILIYMYRTSHFSRIIFQTRDFSSRFIFSRDSIETHIIFELRVAKRRMNFCKTELK